MTGFSNLEKLLLVDPVAHHVAVKFNLLFFKALRTDSLLADLAAQNLAADEVLSTQHELHLVEDETDLLFGLQRAVGLDLDLLDDLGGLVNLAVLFEHLYGHASALRILALSKHLSITCLSEGCKEVHSLFASRHLFKKGVLTQRYHISGGFLRLTSSLDKHD